MKLLTVAVPCYQSQDYMRHCIKTLLAGGDAMEILIINDGSTDRTGEIADNLQAEHPHIIRAIHQENAGHGGAVMTGIRHATGKYFKVVDSDDWVEEEALQRVIAQFRALEQRNEAVDMMLCNYVYDKAGAKHKRVMRYPNVFRAGEVCTWDDIGSFVLGQYILMHSVIFRTEMLRGSGLELPRNTFYVDNLFVYIPMQHVKSILYLDLNLYHYFIGREDQSVNETVMISRIDQQILVNQLMLHSIDLASVQPRKLQRYLCAYMEIVTVVSTILLLRAGTPESLAKKKALWQDIRENTPWFHAYLEKSLMGSMLKRDGRAWRKIALQAYKMSQKIVGFN